MRSYAQATASYRNKVRKTANVVMAHACFIRAGITVDTDFKRLAGSLGLTRHQDPSRSPPHRTRPDGPGAAPGMGNLPIRLHLHGRAICQARQPACPTCPLADLCSSHPGR
jgi:endonuclease-3